MVTPEDIGRRGWRRRNSKISSSQDPPSPIPAPANYLAKTELGAPAAPPGRGSIHASANGCHPRVVQDEVLEGHELAGEPKACARARSLKAGSGASVRRAGRARLGIDSGFDCTHIIRRFNRRQVASVQQLQIFVIFLLILVRGGSSSICVLMKRLEGQHSSSQDSAPARPYMALLRGFRRLICPSVWPLLQRSVSAFFTASISLRNVRANLASRRGLIDARPLARRQASRRPAGPSYLPWPIPSRPKRLLLRCRRAISSTLLHSHGIIKPRQ